MLDENTSPRIEGMLGAHGIAALHVETLGLKGMSDPRLFGFALARGYDALVTKDRFRHEVRVPAHRAMRDGLRIFRARFTPKDGTDETPDALADLIIDHWGELERALDSDSAVRLVMLNARQRRITKTVSLPEVLAELERLGG